METNFTKDTVKQIKEAQALIRKVMPRNPVEKTTSEYTIRTIETDLTEIQATKMEAIEVPLKLSSEVKRILDLHLKITRYKRTFTQSELNKFSGMLASICFKTENKVGIDELLNNSTVLGSSDGIASWDTASPADIEEMVKSGLDVIQELTTAKVSLLVGTDKRKYLRKRNDYGLSAESELKGDIANIYATSLLKGTNKAILVPYDLTIVSFNIAEKFSVETETYERTMVKIIGSEAVGPADEDKEGVVVLSGI